MDGTNGAATRVTLGRFAAPAALRTALFVAVASVAAGCGAPPRNVFPGLDRLPPGGDPLPPSFFAGAAQHAGQRQDGRWILPLPGYLSAWDFTLRDDGAAALFRGAGAFGPILTLPFYAGAEERVYGRDGTATRNRARWTPFYAATSTDGVWPDGAPRSDVFGFPLLFTVFDDYGVVPSVRADGWLSLWTLGPSFYTFESEAPGGSSGWTLHPLTAAGLGGVLWLDYCITQGTTLNSGHGPLFGLLGWFQHMERVEPGRFFRVDGPRNRVIRTLLGGVLWWSFEERDDAGAVRDSTHGPLFGMFGAGTWDGDPIFRFLWMPIWY